MFYQLLFKNLKIKINRTTVLQFVLEGCDTGSAEFGEDPGLFRQRNERAYCLLRTFVITCMLDTECLEQLS
jgi:hypothetical protein